MNSLGLTIFAVVAVVCLSTSSALPTSRKEELASLLDQLHSTYQMAIKRNFCSNPFLDTLAEDFCMRKRGSIPSNIADFVNRARRDTDAALADTE